MKRGRKNEGARRTARLIWGYRVELGLLAVAFAVFWTSALPWFVYVPAWAAVVATALYPRARRSALGYLERALRGARVRRQLTSAARDSGFGDLSVEYVLPTLPGEVVGVHVPRGQTVDKLDSSARAMAACLRVSDVRVVHDRSDRSRADVSIIRRDPFEVITKVPWPLIDAERTSVREPMPLGLDEYGRETDARLLSRNVIVGGAPDSGKSAALRVFAAYALLDPGAKLWMMDGKHAGVEFACWETAAHRVVSGRDLDAAVAMLAELSGRVEDRYQRIRAAGEVFVPDDVEVDVLMIDEAPQFTRPRADDDKNQARAVKTINAGIWNLISLGRAAGMVTILSAHKPTVDIVPSEYRDLFDGKLVMHCNTKAMSDATMGAGSGEEAPANAAEIPSGQPGVSYYVGDQGTRKIRTFFISPRQARDLASRVAAGRLDNDLRRLDQERTLDPPSS